MCERCGGRALGPLVGPASVRGARWAENVVRALVGRWPVHWPRSPRSMIIARRWIADLAASEQQRGVLVEVCLQAASRRYSELTDYLRRRRLKLPGARDDDVPDVDDLDGEIPR